MAVLPYSAVLDDLEQPASVAILRGWTSPAIVTPSDVPNFPVPVIVAILGT